MTVVVVSVAVSLCVCGWISTGSVVSVVVAVSYGVTAGRYAADVGACVL